MSKSPQQVKLPSPIKVLTKMLNKEIVAKLKGGVAIKGVLTAYDGCMNLVLDSAAELDNSGEPKTRYGRIVVRGSQVIYVSALEVTP
ncbi:MULTISPECIES: U6 snRNA-associated Sm-like protein LSm6 [Pyrobaculum]|uniref:Small nuclear ribonucleoprotein, LSM family n=3 Tax=Pyrobaculum TaxID=2276 RepID=A4WNA9_PYRAR|nr:U6 snRNA-associated Sm-like protein LSm6 [Pyrobaculum arsenaticum]ABP51876.1 Small nuclear ribonucleoprotein, LSM family [Pyrobaculum arsenaticum DSM 13514]AFA40560.1 Small nuclear ribonucleoprotein-like (snRNP) [Pyrobaculum oguniense TE7]MCY0891430.1 U6 snRNA-associated Sm-like protein LSm6 [Pyrobaculum arsenaticum]NYR16196.1 small nuclear ribonucleoprotein (Sm) [Pyrobaculum arsenaticum]